MTKFIAIVSGKGGVGKTTTTINLGHALTKLGKKTILVDANLVTPNLGIQLGFLNPEGTINKFLRKEKTLKEITYLHESGLSIIPASPSFSEFQKTNPQKIAELIEHLDDTADFVLIGAPSGLGFEVNEVLKQSEEALLVVTPNLSSVMDALKTIQLARHHNNTIAGIVLNMTHNGRHEMKAQEVEELLGHHILGNIKYDRKMRKALHKQMPLTYTSPWSKSAREFKNISHHLALTNLHA